MSEDPRGRGFACSLELDSLPVLPFTALPNTFRVMHNFLQACSNPIIEHNGPVHSFPIAAKTCVRSFVQQTPGSNGQ